MKTQPNTSVMDALLSGQGNTRLPEVEELNCLIYRNPMDAPIYGMNTEPVKGPPRKHGLALECTQIQANDILKVSLSASGARIRLAVTDAARRNISIERITETAISAILRDLEQVPV